jgi:hypothetical protein
MLRRLTLGFAGVITAAIAIAACSSSNATQSISVGPNFPTQTLYAADVTQNAVNIYSPGPKSTAGPLYQIGGGSTTIAGPQYLTFDSLSDLWVTNWLSSTTAGEILEFKAEATGNVLPYQSISTGNARPRGIADYLYTFLGTTTSTDVLAVAVVDPGQSVGFNSGIVFYTAALLSTPYETLAGPATTLNVPSGVAVDAKDNIYVTNLQGASVAVFALPSVSPAPSPTATPTASPTPLADAERRDGIAGPDRCSDRNAPQHRADCDDFGRCERYQSALRHCARYRGKHLRRRPSLDGLHARLPSRPDLPGGFERCGNTQVDFGIEHGADRPDRRESR